MANVFLGLGGNLGDRRQNLERAIDEISCRVGKVTTCSHFYETEALTIAGAPPQPRYLNCAVEIRTELAPHDVLRNIQLIEAELGRERREGTRWEARPVDIDILLWDASVLNEGGLTIPHKEMHKRDFVLVPLADIAPKVVHPVLGETIEELEKALSGERFVRERMK